MNPFAEPRRRALGSIDCRIGSPPQIFIIPDALSMSMQVDLVNLNAPIVWELVRKRSPTSAAHILELLTSTRALSAGDPGPVLFSRASFTTLPLTVSCFSNCLANVFRAG
jgi:hypothetical protein